MAPKTPYRKRRKAPHAPAEVARLRLEMDRLNAKLLRLIERRVQLAMRIGRAKARLDLPAADPERERAMLLELLRASNGEIPRRDLERIFRALIGASRSAVLRDRSRR